MSKVVYIACALEYLGRDSLRIGASVVGEPEEFYNQNIHGQPAPFARKFLAFLQGVTVSSRADSVCLITGSERDRRAVGDFIAVYDPSNKVRIVGHVDLASLMMGVWGLEHAQAANVVELTMCPPGEPDSALVAARTAAKLYERLRELSMLRPTTQAAHEPSAALDRLDTPMRPPRSSGSEGALGTLTDPVEERKDAAARKRITPPARPLAGKRAPSRGTEDRVSVGTAPAVAPRESVVTAPTVAVTDPTEPTSTEAPERRRGDMGGTVYGMPAVKAPR